MTRRDAVTLLLAALLPLPACADGAPSIAFDLDACEHCRMTISDRRYAAAAATATGRTVRFDSLECLAAWLNAAEAPARTVWVTDAMAPGALVAIGAVRFLRGEPGSSPMGAGYIAVGTQHAATPWDGADLTWEALRAEVAAGGPGAGHGGH